MLSECWKQSHEHDERLNDVSLSGKIPPFLLYVISAIAWAPYLMFNFNTVYSALPKNVTFEPKHNS